MSALGWVKHAANGPRSGLPFQVGGPENRWIKPYDERPEIHSSPGITACALVPADEYDQAAADRVALERVRALLPRDPKGIIGFSKADLLAALDGPAAHGSGGGGT
jgi:hypothetical protein